MDFSGHKVFRSSIDSEYGHYYEKYPYATLVLDFFIQLRVARQQKYYQKWLSQTQVDNLFHDAVTKLIKKSLASAAYYYYLYLASYFINNRDSFCIHNSLSDSSFPGLNQLLENIAKDNKWSFTKQWSGLSNKRSLTNMFLLKNISPYRCFISSSTKKELSKLHHHNDSLLPLFLNDEDYMKKLEILVKKDVERSKKLIDKLGINLFVNSGDASAEGRVLNKAIEALGSYTISFAHGYINASNLLGIAPVRSNKLVVWTRRQKEDMEKVLPQEQSKKIEYIGFPKAYSRLEQDSELKYDRCLLVMTYIRPILNDKNLLGIFEKIILDLKKFTKTITIRLHPHEREGSVMISNKELEEIDFFMNKWGLEMSNSDLKTEFISSDFVIGCSTSVLVEAVAAGKRTYDIHELSIPGIEFEGVKRLKAEDMHLIPQLLKKDHTLGDLEFNAESFVKNIESMLYKFKQSHDKFR